MVTASETLRDGSPLMHRRNAMSVDVEDYFQVRAFSDIVARHHWDGLPRRVEANTDRVLSMFSAANVRATFFVLGWVAERFPDLVRQIADAGHEIASHGYGHYNIDELTPPAFAEDIARTKRLLEDISGQAVLGFRAPTFSISRRTWWAYEVLADHGYKYSSSVYPVSHDLYGIPHAPRTPFFPTSGALLEIPMTTVRVLKRNFPASGGGYFRILPYHVSRWAMRRVNEIDRSPCVFYCHPWEFDPGQPRMRQARLKSRLRHYVNLAAMEPRVSRLLRDFSWGRMDEVFLKAHGGAPHWHPA